MVMFKAPSALSDDKFKLFAEENYFPYFRDVSSSTKDLYNKYFCLRTHVAYHLNARQENCQFPFFFVFTRYPLQMDFWTKKYSDLREN